MLNVRKLLPNKAERENKEEDSRNYGALIHKHRLAVFTRTDVYKRQGQYGRRACSRRGGDGTDRRADPCVDQRTKGEKAFTFPGKYYIISYRRTR